MLRHNSKLAVALMMFCVHAATAYPTPMERVSGDNNYLALRNSPSRDLDRFIDSCGDDDDEECGGAPMAAATKTATRNGERHALATKRSSLDRLNGGHTLATKRSSLDRLNGGHTLATKRSSLDRLNEGHKLVARDSLDRLSGDFIGYVAADECDDGDEDGCSLSKEVAAKRSLDRLNGGHTMVAKRDSLDRLNGDFISFADECLGSSGDGCDPSSNVAVAAVAKRMSLQDRLNGAHAMTMDAASRSTEGGYYSDRWLSAAAWPTTIIASDGLRDTIVDRLGADASSGPLSIRRRRLPSESDAYTGRVTRGCFSCAPVIKSSSY